MDVTAVLRLFDEEMRIDPPPEALLRYERRDGLVRVTNHATYVIYSRLSGAQMDAAIAADRAREARLGLSFDTAVSANQPAPEIANA